MSYACHNVAISPHSLKLPTHMFLLKNLRSLLINYPLENIYVGYKDAYLRLRL